MKQPLEITIASRSVMLTYTALQRVRPQVMSEPRERLSRSQMIPKTKKKTVLQTVWNVTKSDLFKEECHKHGVEQRRLR